MVEFPEDRQQRLHRLGSGQQPDGNLGHDAERSLRADHHAAQVVTVPISRLAADPLDRSVGQDDLKSEHVIGGNPVCETVRTTRVLGHVAADRACLLAGGIGRVVEAVLGDGVGQVDVDEPRLDHRYAVLGVDLQDPGHPRKGHQDAAVLGDRAAAQAGTGAPRHDREIVAASNPDHLRDLFRRGWKHDGRGQRLSTEPSYSKTMRSAWS